MKNDVLLEKINSIKDLIEEKFSTNEKGHEAILEQTTKTNGRVTKLEQWKNQQEGAWNLIKFLGISNIIMIAVLLFQHIKK